MAFKTGPYPGSGRAHTSNIITDGKARFTVLSPTLIRMETAGLGGFEDRSTFFAVQRDVPAQAFQARQESGFSIIETARLRLRYRSGSGAFGPENLSVRVLGQAGQPDADWKPGLAEAGNLGGTIRTLDECIGPLDMGLGVLSRDGWHVQDDSETVLFTEEAEPWAEARPKLGQQDWYFFGYGLDYAAALKDLSILGGRIPLPPRYSLGSWYSRYWPYSAAEFLQIAEEYKKQEFPLDVMVIDMDWHREGWTGYSWNHGLIPDPESLLKGLHEQGLKTTLNLHPHDGVGTHEDAYKAFAAAMGQEAGEPKAIPFDITDKKFAKNYFELLLNPLEKQGVDFWWMDWQQGKQSAIDGLDPLMWLNALHFRDREREGGLRGMNFSRWSGWGDQRHPVHFSGDTDSNWEVLEFLVPFTSTAGNVGCAYWSHDIGGHFSSNGRIDPERYLRFLQFGAFSPVLRVHSSRDKDNDRRPWLYGQDFADAARKAYALRARLLPYLYAASRECHDSGLALCRPMYLAYPGEAAAYEAPGQFMLGQDLLVAPATRPGFGPQKVVHVPIWFPAGDWFHLITHERFQGPLKTVLAVPLDGMAVFARAGAPIPMNASGTAKAMDAAEPLVIRIYPGPAAAREHYEDDGESLGYREAAFRKTRISNAGSKQGSMALSLGPSQGDYAGASKLKPRTVVEFPSALEPGGLKRLELEPQALSATASLALEGDWEGPQAERYYQELGLKQRIGLALAQLDPSQRRYPALKALLEAPDQDKVDALIFELSLDGNDGAAQDALRVLAGLSLQAMAVPGKDSTHFELELELRRDAACLGMGTGSCAMFCRVPPNETLRTEHLLESKSSVILRQEFSAPERLLTVIHGNVELELSYKGKLIRLSEPFAWNCRGIKEWLVLGPIEQGQGPQPVAKAEELDLRAPWVFKRFDPKRVVRGIREVYNYDNTFKCPKGHSFAVVILESDQDASVSFGLWHQGKAKVWINGQELYKPGSPRFEAQLRQGDNLVFVRLDNVTKDGGGFYLSAEEAKGSAPRLTFRPPSLDPQSHPVSSIS